MALDTFTITDGTTASGRTTLLNYITSLSPGGLGGVTVSSLAYQGGTASSSVFDSLVLSATVGFGKGILLTSGTGAPARTNTSSSYTVSFSGAGNADLTTFAHSAFSGAGSTNDASVLTLTVNVTDPNVKSINFDVAFGSDEYPEWANSSFVDIGAIWANGVNYALINGAADQPLSVTSKNVTLNNFINNTSGTLKIEYDGLVNKQSVFVPVTLGLNTIKIGVADTGDFAYDSGLFILGMRSSGAAISGTYQSVTGTPNANTPDVLVGGMSNDIFYGYGGNDSMYGVGGGDIYYAGAGGDIGVCGAGNDLFYGEDGNDYAYLGAGDDTAYGGAGNDVLLGQDGNDVLVGGSGFDYLIGGAGADKLYASGATSATDVTVMLAGDGDDVLVGGVGYNYFYGGAGSDTMYGGSGLNIYVSSGDLQGDTIIGGSGQNYVYGSNGGDTVIGGANVDVYVLGSGADVIKNSGGVDYVYTGAGADTLVMNAAVNGVMVVYDFDLASDVVNFTGSSLQSFADVMANAEYVDALGTTVISDPTSGSILWLVGSVKADLGASNFTFG